MSTIEWGWLRQHIRQCVRCRGSLGARGEHLFRDWLSAVIAGHQPNREFTLELVDSRRCPSPELLEAFARGELQGAEKTAIRIHLNGHRGNQARVCLNCQAMVTLLQPAPPRVPRGVPP